EGFSDIAKPERRDDDWDDLPSGAATLMRAKQWFWDGMSKLDERLPGSYHDFIRAYAACCTFADAQIGRVLDALDASPRRDDTIVVLWSDHGFYLGEKDHIEKFALWEKSNHIPFIVVAPGVTEPGSHCGTPVDLSVLYPTLLELSGLPADRKCDGVSIVPLLKDANSEWERPALMTYGRGNHAVRSERWRYIRYADGTEELYDHAKDPNEWTNIAADPEYANVIASHKKWLPTAEADIVPNLKKKR
ncbi:sulfatase-like hydrolase/transferase, partial [bacterium]|nr:sulfatase-like hydrolase/transferase [bacterium]